MWCVTRFHLGGYSVAFASVAIDSAHFPDNDFRMHVSNFDKDRNGVLSDAEIAAVTVIDLYDNDEDDPVGVDSLKGIEYFTALTVLDCRSNYLEELDLSKNVALVSLDCRGNELEKLDLSANTALVSMDCSENQLEELDVSKNTVLKKLSCIRNHLRKLDVTKNTALIRLNCAENALGKLDISKNTALTYLGCWSCGLTALNVTKNTALVSLDCPYNSLEELDVSKNTALTHLDCSGNKLVDLNLGQHSALVRLECDDNRLGELDLSSKTALTVLRCHTNPLLEVDFSKNTALTFLECYSDLLIALDVSKNTALTYLDCHDNQLEELDLSHNTELTKVYCHSNKLTTLDVSECAALTYLDCSDNQLTAFDISKSRPLGELHCNNNKLETLDLKANIRLKDVYCYENELTELDLTKNTLLYHLECQDNNLTALNLMKNTALYWLDCQNNYLVVLDLRKNTALYGAYLDGQTFSPLYITATGDTTYPYQLNFSSYMDSTNITNVHNVSARDHYDHSISTSYSNGVAKFKSKPEKVKYSYHPGYEDEGPLEVTLSGAEEEPVTPLSLSGTFSNGKVKADYSASITVSGADSYTWAVTDGKLPTGLKLKYSGNTATLSGTPTKAGTFTFTLTVTGNNNATGSKTFTVNITKPSISGTFEDTTKFAQYSGTVKAAGGTEPYTWTKAKGTLPKGLTLISSNDIAILSGSPTKAGTFTFKLKVKDKNGVTANKSFTVNISVPSMSGTLSDGFVKANYSGTLSVSGGAEPYTWSVSSGAIPDGLALTYSGEKALISGTPTVVGTFKFTIKVADKNNATASKSFTVKIDGPKISGKPANGVLGAKYSKTFTVSGGVAPYSWRVSSGDVPAGLTFTSSGDKAVLAGTPTVIGTYPLAIEVADANGATATVSGKVKVTKPELSGTFGNGALKAAYAGAAKVTGGKSPYTWTQSGGTIPTGLKLTFNGNTAIMSGTPTETGTFKFELTVADKNGISDKKSFTVAITEIEIPWTFKDGTVKEAYTDIVMATGGTAPYTWSKSGTLPKGLKLTYTDSLAVLSGTPTKAGTFTFNLKVTDKNKATLTKSFTVEIAESDGTDSNSTSSKSGTSSTYGRARTKQTTSSGGSVSRETSPGLLGEDSTNVNIYAALKVVSEDIVESYDGKDSDMVKVKAGAPLRFTVGDWGTEVDGVVVYVDDKPENSVEVSGEGEFTLPAERVHDDFKVGVKAESTTGKRESEELYIIAE